MDINIFHCIYYGSVCKRVTTSKGTVLNLFTDAMQCVNKASISEHPMTPPTPHPTYTLKDTQIRTRFLVGLLQALTLQ